MDEWYGNPNRGPKAGATQAIRRQAKRNSAMLLGAFALTFLLARLFAYPAALLARELSPTGAEILQTLCNHLPFYLAALIIFKAAQGKNGFRARDYLRKPQLPAGQIIALMVIAVGASYAANFATVYVEQLLENLFHLPMSAPSTVSLGSPVVTAIQLISLCLVTPLVEELFFRGGLLGETLPLGTAFAVLTSALSFGLFHMSAAIPFATVMGLCSGYLTVRCRSLLPSIGVHAFINICSLLSNTLARFLSTAEEGSLSFFLAAWGNMLLEGVIVLSIPAAVVLAVILHKKLFVPLPNGCPMLTGKEKCRVYWTHPTSIAFLVLVVIATVFSAWAA